MPLHGRPSIAVAEAPASRRRLSRFRARAGDEAAYTLAELLVVMAILVTVITALTGVFVSGSHAEEQANQRFRAQLQARLALDKLKREVHCASTVSATTTKVVVTLPTPTAATLVSPASGPACPTGIGTYTWCTIGSGTRWALWRIPGSIPTCTSASASTAGARKWGDYLISASVFPSPTYTLPTPTSLAKLHVEFWVNVRPAQIGTYKLVDDIVLRNSTWG